MNPWKVEAATSEDALAIASLVFASAPKPLSTLLTNGDQQKAKAFLDSAFENPAGQFGYANHSVVRHEKTVIGVACSWYKGLPEDFDAQTLQGMHVYFGLTDTAQILQRNAELAAQVSPPNDEQLIIGHISVDPSFQRKGVAKALINHFKKMAEALQKTQLVIDVEQGNSDAIACYQSIGFKAVTPTGKTSHYVRFSLSLSQE